MRNLSQKGFRGIFVGIPQHQKGCLTYVPSTQKIVSLHDVVFDENNSSALAYMPPPNSEEIAMLPSISYIPNATSYHKQAGNVITFAQF